MNGHTVQGSRVPMRSLRVPGGSPAGSMGPRHLPCAGPGSTTGTSSDAAFRVHGVSYLETVGKIQWKKMGTFIVFLPSRKIELDQLFRMTDRKQICLLCVRKWKFQSMKIWGPGVGPQNVLSYTFR